MSVVKGIVKNVCVTGVLCPSPRQLEGSLADSKTSVRDVPSVRPVQWPLFLSTVPNQPKMCYSYQISD